MPTRRVAVKLLPTKNNAVRRLQRKRQNNKLIEFNIQKGVATYRDSFFVNYTDKENGPLSIRLFLLLLYILNSENNYGADSNC